MKFNKNMAEFWIKIIREQMDDFRTYVSDPALYDRLDTFEGKWNVLDAGCGEGYVSRWLSEKGHDVIGMDHSSQLLKAAREAAVNGEVYKKGNVLDMPFDDDSFDAVVQNFVLVELAKPEEAIKEAARVVKPYGRYIFQVTHPFCYAHNSQQNDKGSIEDYFESKSISEKFVIKGLEAPQKTVRYLHPMKRYTEALEENGFSIVKMEEPQPIDSTPADHPVRELMKEPWILLVDAVKYSL